MTISIKTPEEIEKMRAAGKLAASVLEMIGEYVKPGVTTEELDDICHKYITDHGAYPAPLNYHGFLSPFAPLLITVSAMVFLVPKS